MKRILKVLLFPVLPIVRAYYQYRQSMIGRARAALGYDRRRFIQYAGCFGGNARQIALARLIMAYHVLEKGLTMPRRHLNFGHTAVQELMAIIQDFEDRFGGEDPQVAHAVGCVKEYYALHVSESFEMTKDAAYWRGVELFCEAHKNIPEARQVMMTNDEFFAHNEEPFPSFAMSRHTSRHYAGNVDVQRIRNAVKLAMTAPSACNRQFVKVYCVSNHEIRDRILSMQNGNRGFGSDADKLLVVTADLSSNRWPEERNDLYTNAGIFIMNLSYSLHYYKIAHCVLNWSVRPVQDQDARTILSIPDCESITMLLACGNAPKHMLVATSPRKDVDDVFMEVK